MDPLSIFRVVARNPALRHNKGATITDGPSSLDEEREREKESDDGRAHPVYQPAPQETEFFRWRGYVVSVNVDFDIKSDDDEKRAQVLTLRYLCSIPFFSTSVLPLFVC